MSIHRSVIEGYHDSMGLSTMDFGSADFSELTMDSAIRTSGKAFAPFLPRGDVISVSTSSFDGLGHAHRSSLVRSSSIQRRFSQSKRTSFTINKLRFNRNGLYGRDNQLRKLRTALAEVFDGVEGQQMKSFVTASNETTDGELTSSELLKDEANEQDPEQPQQRQQLKHHQQQSLLEQYPQREKNAQQEQTPHQGPPRRRGLVLIHGSSGTGKTALAKQIDRDVRRRGGFFVTGKFDLQQMNEPYAAIISAMGDLCRQILELTMDGSVSNFSLAISEDRRDDGELKFECIRKKICTDLGLELPMLLGVIPSLAMVLGNDAMSVRTRNASDGATYKESSEALKYATRRFLQVVSEVSPLAIVVDDCQWADQPSLDLLNSWVIDDGVGRILFVACYRDDETDAAHILRTSFIDRLDSDDSVTLHDIAIGNISVRSVHELIADATNSDENEEYLELAKIVHAKTLGNPFFVVQFLLCLASSDHLRYNLCGMKWSWDIDAITCDFNATENVADLMKGKFINHPVAREILPVAACLGSMFQLSTIGTVMRGLDGIDTKDVASVSLMDKLQLCVDEGFLEKYGDSALKFVHDKVQEAALDSLEEGELRTLMFKIGDILLQSFSADELENLIFQAVNLLGVGSHELNIDDPKRLQIAKLNMKAGKKALEVSAFAPASKYLEEAISLLPREFRAIDQKMYVDLYTMASSAMYCTAAFDKVKVYCGEVLARKEIPIMDKVEICRTLMDTHTVLQDLSAHVEFGLEVLESVGVRFPKNSLGIKIGTIIGLVKAKMKAKTLSKVFVERLPIMVDPNHLAIMKLLSNFVSATFFGKPELTALVIFEMDKRTSKYGLTPFAAISYGVLAVIFSGFLGDFQTSKTCSEIALSILDRCDSKAIHSRTIQICYAFSLHWKTPLHEIMKPLMDGYTMGMQTGALETAFWNIYFYLEVSIYCGQNLQNVDADFRTYIKQMEDYRNEKAARAARIIRQIATTFLGTEDAMDEGEMISFYRHLRDDVMESSVRRTQIFIACFSGDYKTAADLAIEWADRAIMLTPGQLATFQIPFTAGLACLAMARRTGKSKYKQFGMKCFKLNRQWASEGNPNVVAQDALLEAEVKALSPKKRLTALNDFEIAVLLAGRRGLIHLQALANERFSDFLLEIGYEDDARYRMNEAIKLYSEWGGMTKVERLERSSLLVSARNNAPVVIEIAMGT